MHQPLDRHEAVTIALVALGSNVTSRHGSPAETLRAALSALESDGVHLVAASGLYATPCFPPGAGADFVNAAAALSTALGPDALLAHLHAVERRFGRERRTRWGARTLDLDLLDYGGTVMPDIATFRHWMKLPPEAQRSEAPGQLILPHPRLHERAFVLIPLADVAPDWHHPVLGRSLRRMIEDLPEAEKAQIRRI